MEYYNNDYLMHYGVKGMKWGVRRYQNADGSLTPAGKRKAIKDAKKEAKRQYRSDRINALDKYVTSKSKASEAYEKATAREKDELNKVENKYALKQKTIDAQYQDEINKHERKAAAAKAEMDFWGEDSLLYGKSKERYDDHMKDVDNAKSRWDGATEANRIARDQASIKVRDLFYEHNQKAFETREAAYTKAGEEYAKSMNLARTTYKEAKAKIKNMK